MKPYKTKPLLKERIWGTESWGTYSADGSIPLMVKLIETREVLSVQVHPDDKYAKLLEGQPNGKTEMWVIIDCIPSASIVYGFNKKTDKNALLGLISDSRVAEALNKVNVRKGDCIFIPAGTIHTLGKGILAYEVQQPSDITYRLYDWDREAQDGSRRELHIEKALEVLDYSGCSSTIMNIYDFLKGKDINIVKIAGCEFFDCLYLHLKEKGNYCVRKEDFKAITCIDGSGMLGFDNEEISLQKGDTCIIPSEYGEDASMASCGEAEFIISSCKVRN